MKTFLMYWYYLWGNLISKVMNYGILGHLYPFYNYWMCKSADYDIGNKLWNKPNQNHSEEK
jgi:hypothetical protein